MERMLRALTLIAATAAITTAARASPAPQQAAEATRLFDEGRTLAKQGDFAAACERFARSLALDPHALGTELNLGDCNEHLGRLRKSWELFSLAATDASATGDDRASYARDRLAAIEAKLATLVIHVAHPEQTGLIVTVGGTAARIDPTMLDVLEPGRIEVVARAPGRASFAMTVTAIAGSTLSIEIPALEVPASVPVAVGDEPRSRSRVHLAEAIGGFGIASALTSITLVAVARHDYADIAESSHCAHRGSDGLDCDPTGFSTIHRAQHVADVGTVFAVTSVVALGSAAFVYLTAPRARRIALVPTVGIPGVAAVGAF